MIPPGLQAWRSGGDGGQLEGEWRRVVESGGRMTGLGERVEGCHTVIGRRVEGGWKESDIGGVGE